MNKEKPFEINSVSTKIWNYFIRTDIRALVTFPPLVGFGGFFLILLLMEKLTNGKTHQAFFEIGLGIACLIECIAGISIVIKREMPSSFSYTISGKYAVISGWGIILLFGLGGLFAIGYGVTNLLSK